MDKSMLAVNQMKVQKLTAECSILNASGSTDATPAPIIVSLNSSLESHPKSPQPIQIVNDSIKVKEHLMEENKLYAFQYKSKDYAMTKTNDRIRLYELRD